MLPLVILGMVGVTYAIVNSLTPAQTSQAVATSTSTTRPLAVAPEEVTTTTLDPALATYLQGLQEAVAESRAILAEAETINGQWDNDEADFNTTLQALRQLRDRTQVFVDSVATQTPPAGMEELGNAHAQVIAVADRILADTEGMITGLQAPDTGQQRQAALESLRQGVGEFQSAAEAARATATGRAQA
ncbi:MAG: hypothetical protein M3N51_06220 [Actinomycetota bacterium]|nr:hypothetical protein [Actinomycetota bacterium]